MYFNLQNCNKGILSFTETIKIVIILQVKIFSFCVLHSQKQCLNLVKFWDTLKWRIFKTVSDITKTDIFKLLPTGKIWINGKIGEHSTKGNFSPLFGTEPILHYIITIPETALSEILLVVSRGKKYDHRSCYKIKQNLSYCM